MPGAFAEALVQTAKQTEAPFYPINLPVDTDNDLIVINDSLTSTWASLLATCERMKPLLEPKSFLGNCFE